MFSPSEGLASKAWIIVLGWFPSRERPLAVENLVVQGVVGLEGSGSLFVIDLLALLWTVRGGKPLPAQMVAMKLYHLTFETCKQRTSVPLTILSRAGERVPVLQHRIWTTVG